MKPMPKNITVDLNVVLDVLLERPGYAAARDVLLLGENGSHRLHLSSHAVPTFAYLLEHAKVPHRTIHEQLDWVLHMFQISPVHADLLAEALKSPLRDYEDAVVEVTATECHAEAIITRNIKDFKGSRVPACTPEDYLANRT